MKTAAITFLALVLSGCATQPRRQAAKHEDGVAALLLITALSGGDHAKDFIDTVYPFRSQLVTLAVVGYHRDRGQWPASETEIADFVASSPANPPLPAGSLRGFEGNTKEGGSFSYSTTEDRQRGRMFTVSSQYQVSFPIASYPFASPDTAAAPRPSSSTVRFDWSEAIAQALIQAALKTK